MDNLDRILGRNAVEFFRLGDLPEPNAITPARSGWTPQARHTPAAAEGALR